MVSFADKPAVPADADRELVRRARRGEPAAFAALVAGHWHRVYAQAYRRVGCHADAEEVTQDTFVRVHRALGRFRGDAAFSTWVYRIAANLSHNRNEYWHCRRRGSTVPLDTVVDESTGLTLAETLPSAERNPREAALEGEFARALRSSARNLPRPQQHILSLRNRHRCSYGEIARRLGVSVGTVKSRLSRARDHLRRVLAASGREGQRAVELFPK